MRIFRWIYIISIILCGSYLFAIQIGPYTQQDMVLIYFLVGMIVVIDRIAIPLPTKQYLHLDSTVLLATLFIYDVSILMMVLLITNVYVFFYRKLRLWQGLYNISQFAIMLFAAKHTYLLLGGIIGELNFLNPWPFFVAAIVYMMVNALLVSAISYFFNKQSFLNNLYSLFRDSAGNYFMMIIYAFILTMLFKVQTYIGSVIFIIMIVLMADNYKRYFQLLERMREKANCDELTGIYNHRYFQQALKEEFEKADTNHKLSLLFIDIDHFKKYNDTYGHQGGDDILKKFSSIVGSMLPEKATFARYGGEEFVVILPDTETKEAYQIAENIRKTIQTTSFQGMSIMPNGCLTVSIGVSTYPDISPDARALVRNADQALYAAKRMGRNKSKVYSIKTDAPKDMKALRSDQELHQLVESLMVMLKNKDEPTYHHSMRVCQYVLAFAEWLNLSEEDRRTLEFAAILHDLGKIEIPREILNKKDKLLEHEWEWIKKHSEYGESLLNNIPELKSILPIVRHHHERYDGKGYPDGLKGGEIPYLARLLTVVDSFDAMTTNRSYQRTKTYNESIEELSRCSESQFDPFLLKEFIKMLEKIRDQEHGMLKHVEGI